MIRNRIVAAAALLAAGGAAACATDGPTAPAPPELRLVEVPMTSAPLFDEDEDDEGDDDQDDSDQFLSCPVASQRVATRTIGPQGGTITVGRHSLRVPSGALSRNVTITATQVPGAHAMVDFQPHGLVFAKPARLILDFSPCRVPRPTPAMSIAYVTKDTAGTHIQEFLPTSWLTDDDDDEPELVTAPLNHFSGYVIGWSRTRWR